MLYFDHNATAPIASEVAEAFSEALRSIPGNASSTHRAGQFARQRLEAGRATIASKLGCQPAELVFTSGGTESNNLAILGLVRNTSATRKHVITTEIEHPSVVEPLRQLRREGVEITFASVGANGIVDAGEIEDSLRPESALVSVMHANNETGAVQPIQEIAALVARRRASGQQIYLHTDGVQAFGKLEANANQLGVDFYSLSAHKIHGPKGVGALFVRNGTPMRGIQFGGRHERDRRAGTENVPGVIAFARAVELLPKNSASDLAALRDRFEHQVLSAIQDVEVNGSLIHRLPNTSNLLFRGLSGEVLLIALDTAGFAVSTGSACSSGSIEPSHALIAMRRSVAEARSSLRFSFGRTNTFDEVDQLAAAVIATVCRLRKSKAGRPQLVAG